MGGPRLKLPMRRLGYDEAISRFGTDRPDTRFGLELVDLAEPLRETEFKVFRAVIDSGGVVRGLNAGRREMPRSALDALICRAQELGAKGLVWAFREGEGWRSPTAKFLSAKELAELNRRLGAGEGDLLLIVADRAAVANAVLAQLRLDLAAEFDLIPAGVEELLWIVDWPLMAGQRMREAGIRSITRSPRRPGISTQTIPVGARALAYDVVWNGQEMGGGSIRISDAVLQAKVFAALGIDAAEAEARFGFLLEALRFGAPPHGGIAYGVDRIVQRLSGAESIRDVIAFPKTASGGDPLTGAPAPVEESQLRELGLQLRANSKTGRRGR